MDQITPLITSLGNCVTTDIENPTLEFRRLKLLWQLVLGIEESSNSIELLIISNTLFVLISSQKDIGDAKFSRSEVEALDRQSGTQDDASLLIGVLNKVRKTVYLHADLVSNAAIEEYIANLLAKDLELTLENSEIDTVFDCEDRILRDCYKKGLAMLLMAFNESDSKTHMLNLLISSSKNIVSAFLKARRISYMIEMDSITDYHQQIISVMKYIFRKHTGYDELINSFFAENPIFPLLRATNETTTLLLKKLELPLLLNIITQMCQAEKEKNTELPITMEFMPQILKYYIDSLAEEGYSNDKIEEDFYVKMVKTCTLKWVDNVLDTKEYLNQLIDLSLVPSAMPYVFHGVKLPNIHMRRALYSLKEAIRLKDIFFNGWLQRSRELPVLLEAETMWNEKLTKQKWNTLKHHFQLITQNNRLANMRYREATTCKYLSIWVSKIGKLNELESFITSIRLQSFWEKWSLKFSELRENELAKSKKISINKLKLYFSKWKKAKEQQFLGRRSQFQALQKVRFFNLWSSKTSKRHDLLIASNKRYEKNCKATYFNAWKRMSKTSLSKIHELNSLEKRIHQKRIFDILQHKTKLNEILKAALNKRNFLMTKWIFSYWTSISKLFRQGTNFNKKTSNSILANTFHKWKKQHELNKSADSKFMTKKISHALYLWRLKLRERQVIRTIDERILGRNFVNWKLNTVFSKATYQKDIKSKAIVMDKWKYSFKKHANMKSKSDDLRALYLKRLYYTIWKSYNELVIELSTKELYFQNRSQISKSVLKRYLSSWRLAALKSEIRAEDLEKRADGFIKGKLQMFLNVWKEKKAVWDQSKTKALDIYQKSIFRIMLSIWLQKYDQTLENLEKLQALQDNTDVSNIKGIVSKWAMKMIKIRNDERKCLEFIARWDRNRKRTFLELWRMRPSFNMDISPFDDISVVSTPTPTEKIAAFTPRRTPRIQKSEASLLQSVERVRRRELAERLERYKIKY